MSIEELKELLSDVSRISREETMRDYDITSCEVRQTNIKNWLKSVNLPIKTFKQLEDNGLITARHSGTAKNSPLVYSIIEIRKALLAKKISNIFINQKIKSYERITDYSV